MTDPAAELLPWIAGIVLILAALRALPRRRSRRRRNAPGRGRRAGVWRPREKRFPDELLPGRIRRVVDGDSIEADVSGYGRISIRLANVDAPEHDQPWGREAGEALARLVRGGSPEFRDRAHVEEPGGVAAAAPLAGEDPVNGHPGGADCRPDLPSLFPAAYAAGGDASARQRPDVHVVGDQDRRSLPAGGRTGIPVARRSGRLGPGAGRLRWVVQSSSANIVASPVPGASAWRMMATMPGADRGANRSSAADGAGGRRRAAVRATARSRRFIGRCGWRGCVSGREL